LAYGLIVEGTEAKRPIQANKTEPEVSRCGSVFAVHAANRCAGIAVPVLQLIVCSAVSERRADFTGEGHQRQGRLFVAYIRTAFNAVGFGDTLRRFSAPGSSEYA